MCLFSQSPISNFVGGKLEVECLLITVVFKNHKNKCTEETSAINDQKWNEVIVDLCW